MRHKHIAVVSQSVTQRLKVSNRNNKEDYANLFLLQTFNKEKRIQPKEGGAKDSAQVGCKTEQARRKNEIKQQKQQKRHQQKLIFRECETYRRWSRRCLSTRRSWQRFLLLWKLKHLNKRRNFQLSPRQQYYFLSSSRPTCTLPRSAWRTTRGTSTSCAR